MADRGRYDSAMFWLAFGTAAAVIGLALMTIGATRSAPGANLVASPWFDGGLVLLIVGGLLLLWALSLYLARRRADATTTHDTAGSAKPSESTLTEAVRGYYAEREKLIDVYKQERDRTKKT